MRDQGSRVRLGDILTLKRGYDLAARERRPGNVPIVSSAGVSGAHDVAKASAPGVITGRYGTLGKVHFSKLPFWPLNTTLYVTDFKENDPRYCAALLEFASLGGRSAAAAVPGLNRNDLHEILVPSHSVGNQRRIAAILSAYDDLIENNRHRVEILEETIHAIYSEWFEELRFSHGEIIELEWESRPFSSLVEVNPRERPPSGVVNYLPMDSLSARDMTLGAFEARPRATGAKFRNSDTLMARITPSLENGKTGFVAGLRDDEVACGSTEFIVLRGKELSPEFVYCLARSDRVRSVAIGSMTGATGRQRVFTACFDELNISVPPPALDKLFVGRVRSNFVLVQALSVQNRNLAAQRDLLLPKLISGELDVRELDIDTSRIKEQEALAREQLRLIR